MYEDLRELYQQTIIEHSKHPRNRRQPDDFNREALGKNPTCGDALVVYLKLNPDGLVEDCAFIGEGCAISLASASMMTEIVKGKTEAEARRLIEAFHGIATGKDEGEVLAGLDEDDADRLHALSGVRRYPVRVKCATLAWHTLGAALAGKDVASTEG